MCWWIFMDVEYLRHVYEYMKLNGDPADEYSLLSERLSVVVGATNSHELIYGRVVVW